MILGSAPTLRAQGGGYKPPAGGHRPLLGLPKYHDKDDKYSKKHQSWRTRLQLLLPTARRHLGRKRGAFALVLSLLVLCFTLFALVKRFASKHKSWPGADSPTLVFRRESLGRVWAWEVASGHHPSTRAVPQTLGLKTLLTNPAVPPTPASVSRFKTSTVNGVGPKRIYTDVSRTPLNSAYPPRPIPGSVADLDVIVEHCDFGEGKYVRDCLELLRLGGGLDNGNRVRRGSFDDYKYIFVEDPTSSNTYVPSLEGIAPAVRKGIIRSEHEAYLDEGFTKSRHAAWEPPIVLPAPSLPFRYSPGKTCDLDDPRIFHMYWTGPFTDKPYLSVLSFLFTQNTGLHVAGEEGINDCTPQLWIWINLGPAAAVSDSATGDLVAELKSNVWAAPFLHSRFKHIIHFKIWNTAEQLDSLPETTEWRSKKTIFKSGGHVLSTSGDQEHNANLTGSLSPELYDKLSVIMSDIARFVLCYKHGGIYIDADTLFLRDWEELWGWKGSYAYRWSWHDKYNTAVLRLRKRSALGHFLIRTAVKNGFDFHPFEITKYLKEGRLVHLLTRLPDALFDGAWLNMEGYQRERPPQPFFTAFEDFFVTPLVDSGAPLALGFHGFFSGAYAYHIHNGWWFKVDPARNWPDLGPRFQGESSNTMEENLEDRRDLDWSTVLKRTFESYLRGERPNMYGEFLVM